MAPMRYGEIPGLGARARLVLGTVVFTAERMERAAGLLDAFLATGATPSTRRTTMAGSRRRTNASGIAVGWRV